MRQKIIEKVKVFLNIKDELQDELLSVIYDHTVQHLRVLCGRFDIPSALDFVIVEVMIIRFNRIGSEGMHVQNVDGLSQTFMEDDFQMYKNVILAEAGQSNKLKGIKFI